MNARIIPFQRPQRPNQQPAGYDREDPYLTGFMDAAKIIGDGLAKRNAEHTDTVMRVAHDQYAEGFAEGLAEGFRQGRDAQRRWDRRVAS